MRLRPLCAALICAAAFLTLPARAEIKTQVVEYKIGDTVFEGMIAFDDAKSGKRPGVVIYHQWTGPSDHERKVAQDLARQGYVAFVADVYGKGVRPPAPKESAAEMTKYMKDRALLRVRSKAAFDQLAARPEVDATRIAAIGYCFGGTAILELGRSGVPAKSYVSLHGVLNNPAPEDAKNIKAPVLVLHGAADTFVSEKEVETFLAEMKGVNGDVTFVSYSGAPHGFTLQGPAFRPLAAARAWSTMGNFLSETLSN